MGDVVELARQFLAARTGEKGAKGEKPPDAMPLSPLSPFSPGPVAKETVPPAVPSGAWPVLASTDSSAVGGYWLGTHWHPAASVVFPVEPLRLAKWSEADEHVANRLMEAADALVERIGVSGSDPSVRDAAAIVGSALAFQNLETVRFACSEFAVVVRTVAAQMNRPRPV